VGGEPYARLTCCKCEDAAVGVRSKSGVVRYDV
jgi:hypothetical protein